MNKNYMDANIDINKLGLLSSTNNLLKANNINTIDKLLKIRKSHLKNIGFTNSQIKEIQIKLQLNGLDFNANRY